MTQNESYLLINKAKASLELASKIETEMFSKNPSHHLKKPFFLWPKNNNNNNVAAAFNTIQMP